MKGFIEYPVVGDGLLHMLASAVHSSKSSSILMMLSLKLLYYNIQIPKEK